MDQAQPFVVPAGVVFQIEEDGVTIENRGDIVLHTNFGRVLKRVVSSEGSITLHTAVNAGIIHAAGNVYIDGAGQASEILAGGSLQVTGDLQSGRAQAGGSVQVGGNAGLGEAQTSGGISVNGSLSAGTLKVGGDLLVGGSAALQDVDAGGNVQVHGGLTATNIQAGGTVAIAGAAQVGTIHGEEVRLVGGNVVARGLQAWKVVELGAGRVQVDVVVAPNVDIDPKASGRITLLEAANEVGPNALKGCFSMADYTEMFGDAEGFLKDRSIDPASVKGAAVRPPPPTPVDVPPPPPVRIAPPVTPVAPPPVTPVVAPVAPVAQSVVTPPTPVTPPPTPVVTPPPPPVVPVTPVDVAVEPVEEQAEDSAVPQDDEGSVEEVPSNAIEQVETPKEHPLHGQLVEAVSKVVDAYADSEPPPAVEKLKMLVDSHAYDRVRTEITQIWSELLKFHQRKGVRLPHQVTPTFNTINSLVKKM